MHCFPLEYGWFIRSYTLRENWLSLFQKLSLANICSVQIRTSCPILQFMLGFSLVWAYTGSVLAVMTSLSSYEGLLCYPKKLIPCSYPAPLIFQPFMFPLQKRFLHVGREVWNTYVPFMAEHSSSGSFFSILLPVMGLSVNHHVLQIEVSLIMVERFINLWI